MAITAFRDRWEALSNFSRCDLLYEGRRYRSVEHAYQAMKSLDPEVQRAIADQPTPGMAKKLGRQVALRPDWALVQRPVMLALLREKFRHEPAREILLATGSDVLVEGNTWGDRFWGQCPVGQGENWLGRLLMQVRAELAAGNERCG